MKKYIIVPLIIFLILPSLQSCKKYLDEKSDAALVVPSTIADFQNLLDDGNTMNYSMPSLGIASADDYFIDNAAYNSKSILFQHIYKWAPYPYKFQNDWSYCYKAIYSSNLCLERLALLPRTDANAGEWDNIKGSALFYKAYRHLELALLFAKAYDESTADSDLGIVLRQGTDFLQASLRSTVRGSYQKIIDDTKLAAGLLPDEALVATRPSRCAAYALLARTYTAMRMYDSAGKYANLSLVIRSSLMNYNDAAVVSRSAPNPFRIFNSEVIFHGTASVWVTLHHPSSGPAKIDTALWGLYNMNDLRREAFFTPVAGYQRFKGSYSGSASNLFSGLATDEMLLTRAECKAREGDKVAALNDLNILLQQRYAPVNFVPVEASTAEAALDSILLERRKELLYRGSLRWMDVKRLNKEGRDIIMKRMVNNELFSMPPNDKRFALQIPDDVIQLSGMQQN